MSVIKIGIIQFSSLQNISFNWNKILKYLADAIKKDCRIIVFPEYSFYRGSPDNFSEVWKRYKKEFLPYLKEISSDKNILLIPGTVQRHAGGKYFNTMYALNSGEVFHYDKRNLFKAKKGNLIIREDFLYRAGNKGLLLNFRDLIIGFGICFDLRFPEMFFHYRKRKAGMLIIPSDFTHETGKLHWEILLRSRAIENQAYVLGVNQTGKNLFSNIVSYGNSMLVSPMGEIIIRFRRESTLKIAEIDTGLIRKTRNQIIMD